MTAPLRGLSEDEAGLLTHISRWGSDGYPVRRLARRWTWEFRSLRAPTLYRTKGQAVAAFEGYLDVLRDAKAGRV